MEYESPFNSYHDQAGSEERQNIFQDLIDGLEELREKNKNNKMIAKKQQS